MKSFSNSEQQYLSNHLNKLLDNFNPMGIPIVFWVSYSKCKKEDFGNYWLKYCDYLKHYSNGHFSNRFICEHKQIENYLRCVEYSYQCGDSITIVYHIVVRMNE